MIQLYMLGWLTTHTPLTFMIQSIWTDEAFSYLVSKQNIVQILTISANDYTPPLYYILLHVWMKIFGTSEVALRSLSFVFYVVSIWVFYYFAHNLLRVKGKIIWVYILLFAMNPFILYFAFEARAYSLFALLSLLSFVFFIKREEKNYLLVTVLGLYTHYYFLFVIATQVAHLLLFKNKWVRFLKVITLSIGIFLPWLIYNAYNIRGVGSETWVPKQSLEELILLPGVLFTGYEQNFWNYYDNHIFILSILLLAILLVAFKLQKQLIHPIIALLGMWAFLFFLLLAIISLQIPLFVPRYLIFAPVGFIALLTVLMDALNKRVQFTCVVILMLLTLHSLRAQILFRKKADIRKTARLIQSTALPTDKIYVTESTLFFPFQYYLGEDRVFIYGQRNNVPHYVGRAAIPDEKIVEELPPYPKKAYIVRDATHFVITMID